MTYDDSITAHTENHGTSRSARNVPNHDGDVWQFPTEGRLCTVP